MRTSDRQTIINEDNCLDFRSIHIYHSTFGKYLYAKNDERSPIGNRSELCIDDGRMPVDAIERIDMLKWKSAGLHIRHFQLE